MTKVQKAKIEAFEQMMRIEKTITKREFKDKLMAIYQKAKNIVLDAMSEEVK